MMYFISFFLIRPKVKHSPQSHIQCWSKSNYPRKLIYSQYIRYLARISTQIYIHFYDFFLLKHRNWVQSVYLSLINNLVLRSNYTYVFIHTIINHTFNIKILTILCFSSIITLPMEFICTYNTDDDAII